MKKTATQVMEDRYTDAAAKNLQEEIDAEILFDMLIQFGWTRVELSKLLPPTGKNINNWMHNECKKDWKRRGKVWIFEDREEAALFKLTWS